MSLDKGVDFLDTADVYGDHTSERLIAGILKERRKQGKSIPIVATKIGRRLPTQDAALFTYANLAPFVEDSLKALEVDALDLVQLHCPPIETYYRPEAFEAMDRLQREGKIRFHGVSVEKVEEGLKALEYPGVVSVQIIYNMFRQRPDDLFLGRGAEAQSRRHCARAACERSVGRANSSPTASLTQVTIVSSTVTGKHSTWARLSRAFRMKQAWLRSRR